MKKKIIHVVGARPNFMKAAPIMEAIRRYNAIGGAPRFEQILVHTGQHYDRRMSQSFFDELEMPEPDINLEVGSASHAEQVSRIMIAFETVLLEHVPDLVIVVGDVNSTMACTITAKKLNVEVAHVEAGLRSGDMTMPEEINRKVTDAIADYMFTTDRLASQNLEREGTSPERIFFVGNVMIDSLLDHRAKAARSPILDDLGLMRNGRVEPYAVITLHRPSNVDEPDVLRGICEALTEIAERLPVIFPCHPRTAERLERFELASLFGASLDAGDRLIRLAPLGYLDLLHLNSRAKVVLTDSGGIQEETTILGVPCITLRANTERPITVEEGTNRLCGNRKEAVLSALNEVIDGGGRTHRHPDKWDGKAAERIVAALRDIYGSRAPTVA